MKKQPVLRLASVSAYHIPHVTPVWFVYENRTFYIAVDQNTKKLDNIKSNNKVALVIDSYNPDNWDSAKGISFTGTAEVVEVSEETEMARMLLKQKYPDYASKYSDWLDGREIKSYGVIIKVIPSRWSFWTD